MEAARYTQGYERDFQPITAGVGDFVRSANAPQASRRNDEDGSPAFEPREHKTRHAAALPTLRSSRLPADCVLMEGSAQQRQQFIANLMAQQPENIADTAMGHWEKLADEIISIIGEAGFASLYERSMHQAQSTFPWLPPGSLPPQPLHSHRFAELGMRLADQTPDNARAAHSLLLTIFTDILASLIGEQLTSSILRAAWGNLAPVTSGKELDNE